jgi:AbrB family looped-hinge helix DNA binding protein
MCTPPTVVLWQSVYHISTMRSTIDAAGRVVIPKALRERLGLTGGEPIEIRERDGTIEIEAAPTPMSLMETADGAVAVPDRDLPPLTDELVRATVERTRR